MTPSSGGGESESSTDLPGIPLLPRPPEEASSNSVIASQAIYNNAVLAVYDFYVLGISNSFAWKCKTMRILERYNRYVSSNHLDVGVGTGFYLDRCTFPTPTPKITLGDPNTNCLEKASKRIRRYN